MLRTSGPTSISLTACCPRYRVQHVRTQVDSSIETSPSPVDRKLDIRFRKLGDIRQDTIPKLIPKLYPVPAFITSAHLNRFVRPWRLRLFHPVLIMLTLSYMVRR